MQGGALAAAALAPSAAQSADALHTSVANTAKAIAGKKSVSLRLLHPQGCRANLEPVVAAFEKLTGIKVHLTAGSLDDLDSEIRLNLTKQKNEVSFDLALPATFNIPDLINNEAIVDLSDFALKHEPALLREKMLYTVGNYFGGSFYGYQADGDAYVMFYNRALPGYGKAAEQYADQFGQSLETPATWEELDRQLSHFHRPSDGMFGGSLYRSRRYVGWEFWSRLHGNGRYPVNSDFEPQFTEPEGLAALESLIGASRHLEPDAARNGLFENFQSFSKGDKFANIGWGGTQKYLLKNGVMGTEDITHGQLPGGLDTQGVPFNTPYFNWGWNYVVLSRSPNQELAYLFSLFATTPDIATRAVQQIDGFFDPHLRSHYKDKKIQAIYGESFLGVHRASMENAIPDFQVRFQGRYKRVLADAVFAADQGLLRPKQALLEAASKWRAITEEAGVQQQRDQWSALRSIYPVQLRRSLV